VYSAIKEQLIGNGTEEIRIGLTKLKALTGLSDKTIRVSIKSLEMKKSIIIKDSSMGIYGRKYFLPDPSDVVKTRLEFGIEIDKISKHLIPR
jgi:predicted transcriptional regulator